MFGQTAAHGCLRKDNAKAHRSNSICVLDWHDQLYWHDEGLVGSAVNTAFVGVSQNDLSNYYILVCINIVMWVTPVFYMWLLPTKAQLELKAKSEELESVEMASPQTTNADDKKRLNLSETSNSVD